MQTKLLTAEEIDVAVDFLKRGEPVAIPTETVYGLAACIFDSLAIKKIFSLKQRPSDNPLIAHIASFSMVDLISSGRNDAFQLLTEAFWPGPLTLVLPKLKSVPDIASAGLGTIGLRMPSHPLALRLIEAVGQPLVAPSANLSGKPSPTTAEHVLEDFSGRLAAVLEGGACSFGIESTVLSLVTEVPILLRPGSISKKQIEQVLNMPIVEAGAKEQGMSPGMKYRHYAPKAPIRLVRNLPSLCKRESFILSSQPTGLSVHRPLNAKTLYAFFREADRMHVEEIWILLDPISSLDEALMNRLQKAAGLREP